MSYLTTVILLICSNVFMTIAWYGHLKFKGVPIWKVILISWSIAFVEYCLMIPANRWGSAVMSAAQLKMINEVITLSVFAVFSVIYLKQNISMNYLYAFMCLLGALYFIFRDK